MTDATAESHTRIILETALDGDAWFAWQAGSEYDTWEGQTAREALQNLLDGGAADTARLSDLIEDPAAHREGHIECVSKEFALCADCRGSGKYVGFNVVEECQTCDGAGLHLPIRIDVIKRRNVYRLLFKRYFEQRHGYAVSAFGAVESYLYQLSVDPDCIVCGMELPDGGPFEMLSRLADLNVTSPLIVSTNAPEFEEDLLQMGAFAILSDRQFGRDSYVDIVKQAVASRRAAQKRNSTL